MIKKFLSQVSSKGTIVQIGTTKVIGCINGDDLESYLKKNENDDIYFLAGVSPELKYSRAKDSDVQKKKYLYFDLDIRKDSATDISDEEIKEMAFSFIERMDGTKFSSWSYIIFSGNGLHIYFIGDTVDVDKKLYANGYRVLAKELSSVIGWECDPACNNIGRIARLPGSYNNKKEKKIVEVVAQQDKKSDMVSIVLEEGKKKSSDLDIKRMIEKERIENQNMENSKKWKVIQSIPVQDIMLDIFPGWEFVKGKNFITPEEGNQSACFVHSEYNAIVRDGSREFASANQKGFTPFGLVRHLKDLTKEETFQYFEDKYPMVRDLAQQERIDHMKTTEEENDNIDAKELIKKSNETIDFDNMFFQPDGFVPFTWFTDKCNGELAPIESHHLVFLIGAASSGKTTLSVDMAIKNARNGKKVLYIGLEMTAENMIKSLGRKKAGITKLEWRDKRLVPDEKKQIAIDTCNGIQNLKDLVLFGFNGKKATCDNIASVIKESGCDIVFIDNFNMVEAEEGESDNKKDERVSKYFLDFTNNQKVPVVFIHHLSKHKPGEAITLNSMRGSGKIGDNADIAVAVMRDYAKDKKEDFDEMSEIEKHKTTLICKKDRDFGDGGVAEVYFDKGTFADDYKGMLAKSASLYNRATELFNK